MTAVPLFATRQQVEQLADLLEEVIQVQARLVAIVDRLIPPAERSAPSGANRRPGLRLVK